MLVEANVLNSLHTAEAVKSKIDLIVGLNERVRGRELENGIRDYIAAHPWLIDHRWETFQIERSIEHVCQAAAHEAGLDTEDDWNRRIDLVLSSGKQLLVLEFMRPGLTVDRDHIDRFEMYIDAVKAQVQVNSGLGFTEVDGLLVSDRLNRSATNAVKLDRMAKQGLLAMDWQSLLSRAAARWKEFLAVLIQRAPEDERLRELAQTIGLSLPASEAIALPDTLNHTPNRES